MPTIADRLTFLATDWTTRRAPIGARLSLHLFYTNLLRPPRHRPSSISPPALHGQAGRRPSPPPDSEDGG